MISHNIYFSYNSYRRKYQSWCVQRFTRKVPSRLLFWFDFSCIIDLNHGTPRSKTWTSKSNARLHKLVTVTSFTRKLVTLKHLVPSLCPNPFCGEKSHEYFDFWGIIETSLPNFIDARLSNRSKNLNLPKLSVWHVRNEEI